MAGGGDDLVAKFQEFCTLAGSKDKTQMTSKASGKMVADCLEKNYKKYDIKSICDASVFPAIKEKGKPFMTVNKANVEKYVQKTAHEVAKRKTKNTKIADNDPEVETIKADMCSCISGGGPQVKATKQSATGNVGGLTDASKYTGAHKERFDADGKGKGIEGRADIADNSGYVGNYKGQDTFDKK
ncbi:tubulin polymerization-promoting protein family member 2-like [Mya arenaria]|uniref:tubulin polymerization-promoting protein family member 2-like n=1 Tax=Mya arenaria TaxID=6604 RepID=UPI0022E4E406|nr:tubulin polymerization-promoting protein family member 2-like [Mya arenaria]XP_052791108.1 tubulin polymerization-promoting protein family member 2-like [Mya arenaria]XP_052791109.1 tubulin polymerization-promoting protein family member 2-like [Mya arenaria]